MGIAVAVSICGELAHPDADTLTPDKGNGGLGVDAVRGGEVAASIRRLGDCEGGVIGYAAY